MTKRYREPKAKEGELLAKFGKSYGDEDIFYCWGGGGACKGDSRILMKALEDNAVFEGKTLRQELDSRGYDITTLKFSIMQKKIHNNDRQAV